MLLRKTARRNQFARAYTDAMRAAQLLERALIGTVDITKFLDAGTRMDCAELQELIDASPTKGPMGPLNQRLRQLLPGASSTGSVPDLIAELIRQRNRLAHDYLLEERDDKDLRSAIDELRNFRRGFTLMFFALTRAGAETLGSVGETFLATQEAQRVLMERAAIKATADLLGLD